MLPYHHVAVPPPPASRLPPSPNHGTTHTHTRTHAHTHTRTHAHTHTRTHAHAQRARTHTHNTHASRSPLRCAVVALVASPQGREACHALVVALSRALAVVGTEEAMATANALASLAAAASDATAAFAPAIAPGGSGSAGGGAGGGVGGAVGAYGGGASSGAPLVTGVEVVASAEEDLSPTTRMLEVYAEGEAEAPLGVLLLPKGATLAAVRRMHRSSCQKWPSCCFVAPGGNEGRGRVRGGAAPVSRAHYGI